MFSLFCCLARHIKWPKVIKFEIKISLFIRTCADLIEYWPVFGLFGPCIENKNEGQLWDIIKNIYFTLSD